MACIPELFLNHGQAVGVDIDQSDVPAVLGEQPGGSSADPRRPSGPCWNRNGPCPSPIPTSPASVETFTTTSLTRLIVAVEVRTGWGRGAAQTEVGTCSTWDMWRCCPGS